MRQIEYANSGQPSVADLSTAVEFHNMGAAVPTVSLGRSRSLRDFEQMRVSLMSDDFCGTSGLEKRNDKVTDWFQMNGCWRRQLPLQRDVSFA